MVGREKFIAVIWALLLFFAIDCNGQLVGTSEAIGVAIEAEVRQVYAEAAAGLNEIVVGRLMLDLGGNPNRSEVLQMVRDGSCGLGLLSGQLSSEELDDGVLLSEHVVAEVELGFAVNKELAVEILSNSDWVRICMGQIVNWQEVGGPDLAIDADR